MTTQATTSIGATGNTPTGRPESPLAKDRVNWRLTAVLGLCTLAVLVPLFVTVSMAFKTGAQAVQGRALDLPNPISVEGFVAAWELTDFPVSFSISLFVSAIAVAGAILVKPGMADWRDVPLGPYLGPVIAEEVKNIDIVRVRAGGPNA